ALVGRDGQADAIGEGRNVAHRPDGVRCAVTLVEETARRLLAHEETHRPSLAEVETVEVEVDVRDRSPGRQADGGVRAMDGDAAGGGGGGGDRHGDGPPPEAGEAPRGGPEQG